MTQADVNVPILTLAGAALCFAARINSALDPPMRRLLLTAIILMTSNASSAGDVFVPVRIGDDPDLDACASLGRVTGAKDPKVAVHSGPADSFPTVDSVVNGQWLFVCSTSYDQEWLGVVYSDDESMDCGVASPVSPAKPYDGPCKSGWVPVTSVEIVAG